MKYFFKITAKYWISLSVITALTLFSAVGFGLFFNRISFTTTVFINIGAKSVPVISTYETVQAADHFTESVQGWFKNPTFIEKTATASGQETTFSVRKQEKQNLVVTFKTVTREQGEKMATVIEKNLRSEMERYNKTTDSSFSMPIFNASTAESNISWVFFAGLGLIMGIIIAYMFMIFFDRFIKEWHEYSR